MRAARTAIAGAGLSGLHAAFLLEQQGIGDYALLEARDTPGGRIASACAPSSNPIPPAIQDLAMTWKGKTRE